jgi:LmbE family N-acetylglucosaminyl deacetylase
MCVVAHPDDECVAFGGALALAVDQGAEVSVICLTDGQAATHRGDSKSAGELGAMRRAEFAASCDALGVHHQEVMRYQDAQLEFANMHEIAGKLVERIRSFRPQVVLTFGGDGAANSHPDHTMTCFATTAAFHWAASEKRYKESGEVFRSQRLYYQTTNFFLPDRPHPIPAPWTLRLDISSVFERKLTAFRAHTSQAPLMDIVVPRWKQYGMSELYALAATTEPQVARSSTDLFDGVVDA